MPRYKRVISETGCYHVMIRGNNKANIFENQEDKERMLQILKKIKEKEYFKLYSYCIMNNHAHLVIQDNDNNISSIMKRLNISYAYYYNTKYNNIGHVFQDRYKSEAVLDDKYLLAVIRYIHRNPFKSGIANNLEEYEYSSYKEYIEKENIIETETIKYILGMFSNNIDLFKEFHNQEDNMIVFGGAKEKKELEFEKGNEILDEYCKQNGVEISRLKDNEEIIIKLLRETKLSYRSIAEILKISRSKVNNIGKKVRNNKEDIK